MTDRHFGSIIMEDSGQGPAVVMVHGLGGSSNSFETCMPALDGFRVLRPDLPGAGRSALRPGNPGVQGLVSALRDVLQAADIKQAHFVGHSMGTLICQQLAVTSPNLVSSLTLFGAILEPPVAAKQALKERAAVAQKHGMAGIADAVATGSVSETSRKNNPAIRAFVRESLMRQTAAGYAAHCVALSEAVAADHAAIDCPVLLVAGEQDTVAPVSMGQELCTRIPDARLETVPKVGHWIMIEDVDRSNKALRNHLIT